MGTNLPANPFRWDTSIAAREFGYSAAGIRNKLNAISAKPADDDTYTTSQIVEALYGSMAKAQLDHILEQTESLRLTNAAKRAELLDRGEVTAVSENVIVAIRNLVEGSDLNEQQKKDILYNIATWPIILDNVAAQQAAAG